LREVLYSSPFVPHEWISAHSLLPVRAIPSGEVTIGPLANRAGVCAFAGSFASEAEESKSATGLILATSCDHMRRAADVLHECTSVPVFLFNIPTTWQSTAAHSLYHAELERMGRFLESVGGSSPTREGLAEHLLREDEKDRRAAPAGKPDSPGAIPVALLGGPLALADHSLFECIERAGGRIVLDGTEDGERAQRGRFDRHRTREDPLGALTDAYFGTIPDAFRRPNSLLYEWLGRRIPECGARGVILLRYAWCDLWHAETPRLKEWLKVPLIEIDVTGQSADGRNEVRIQAFMEGLQG